MLFLTLIGIGLAAGMVSMIGDDDDDGAHLTGTPGDDTIGGSGRDDLIQGLEGDDLLGGLEGDDTLDGGGGIDFLYAHSGDDHLAGGEDSDFLAGQEGDDVLRGGSGNDFLHGGTGNDSLNGSVGHDYLRGDDGDDSLSGGYGGDGLHGGDGSDTLDGGEGNDLLNGGDVLVPGPSYAEDVFDDLLSGMSATSVGGTASLINDDDTGDALNGGSGEDTLIGGADDTLTGGEDADEFVAGDWLDAGEHPTVTDFDTSEDMIVYRYDWLTTAPVMTAVSTSNSDGTLDVQLFADGVEVMTLDGAGADFSVGTHVSTVSSPML